MTKEIHKMTLKKLFIETYGCQMNFADSEVVAALLSEDYHITDNIKEADLILINTCSVRDNAEQRIRKRLRELNALKKSQKGLLIGLIGCMAERLQESLLNEEKTLDFIAGPDAYRSLNMLIEKTKENQPAFNVLLSESETYEDIQPIRYHSNGVSAFVSIMRGCNNFCTYCVVPYTRGRERSRPMDSIFREIKDAQQNGIKEITLLGQNVNSYRWHIGETIIDFADIMQKIAETFPTMRIRFATSHPKDISDKLIQTIAAHENLCRYIHLPVQSGSDTMLHKMNRVYHREYYKDRITAIRKWIPDCGISTDIIAGFCGETEADFQDTLEMMKWVGYDSAYMFKYSVRQGTVASKKFEDDIPEVIKSERLEKIIALQQELSLISNQKDIGKTFQVLVEGYSKRSNDFLYGRNSQNKVIIFPAEQAQKGDYIQVKVESCTAATLKGRINHSS